MKKMTDGWHTIRGYRVYVEDGLVRRPDFYGSLYRWDDSINAYNNLLPCTPDRLRYYNRKGNLISK